VVVNFRSFLLFAVQLRLNCESLENVFVPETSTKRANTPHIHGNCIIAPKRRALFFWLASLSKTSPGVGFGTAGQSRCGGKTKRNRCNSSQLGIALKKAELQRKQPHRFERPFLTVMDHQSAEKAKRDALFTKRVKRDALLTVLYPKLSLR
jgi:hypothetical protein